MTRWVQGKKLEYIKVEYPFCKNPESKIAGNPLQSRSKWFLITSTMTPDSKDCCSPSYLVLFQAFNEGYYKCNVTENMSDIFIT